MKKFSYLLLLLALCVSFSADAKFRFGPKLGVNINELHIKGGNFDEDNRCGFTGGLTGEYIAPAINFGFDISVMYTYMTSKVDKPDGSQTNINGNFIEIPLHLKYMFSIPAVNKVIRPYIFTGPDLALKLGGGNDYFKTKTTQWGWDVGVGLQLFQKLQVGAGYTFGINSVANKVANSYDVNLNTTNNIKVKNNYWTVTLAWMFK